jgi:hypothetical protein
MSKSSRSQARECCSAEKERLVETLKSCNIYSTGSIQRHNCYRQAAKETGRKGKGCLLPKVL